MEVLLKRTILASVTVGLAALMTFGCGNVVSTQTGRENNSNQPFTGPAGGGAGGQVFRIFAVDVANNLLSFNSDNPLVIQGTRAITMPAGTGTRITAIDFRPDTGVLYGISNLGRLFTIDINTAEARLVGNSLPPAQAFANDIDFNPTVDLIRQIADSQNARINPDTAATVGVDTNLSAGGNPITGGAATAYTNNFPEATTTQLFTVDSATNAVYLQGGNPNTGVLSNAVPFPFFIANNVGFDITPTNIGFISVTQSGSNTSQLFSFDPGSGTLAPLGQIGNANTGRIQSIAVEIGGPTVVQFAGIDRSATQNLVRFTSTAPQTLTSDLPLQGLLAGETVRGMDVRPGTGRRAAAPNFNGTIPSSGVVVLVSDAAGNARLLQVNLANGNTAPLAVFGLGADPGDSCGVDINPVNGNMRVYTATQPTGNSVTTNRFVTFGGAVTNETNLSFPAGDSGFDANVGPFVVAAGYTNNFLGATTTRLFGIDSRRDTLVETLAPFSGGVLQTRGNLSFDTTEVVGLDIEANNRAWVVARPNIGGNPSGASVLASVNLTTGQANPISTIGAGAGLRVLRDFCILPPGI